MRTTEVNTERVRPRIWAWISLLILAALVLAGTPGCKWLRSNVTCRGARAKQCVLKGMRLQRQKTPQSNRDALELFEGACKGQGKWSTAGCSLAGRMYAEGARGVGKAPAKAQRLLTRGCKGRRLTGRGQRLQAEACRRLGKAYMYAELGLKRNMDRAGPLLQTGCALGDRFACVYAKTVSTYTGKNSLPGLIARCNQGEGVACGDAGWRYLRGLFGEEKNPAKAMKYIERSCTANYNAACEVLGTFVAEGKHGVKQDRTRARKLFGKACRLNASGGCVYLAEMVLNDKRSKRKERRKAVEQLRKYCRKGLSPACLRLSNAYRDGKGVRRKRLEAHHYLNRACRLKNRKACRLLAKR